MSLAAMNLLFALAFAVLLAIVLWRATGGRHECHATQLPGDPATDATWRA